MRDYLTFVETQVIHADQIARYGGIRGLRDPGALESALARPRSGYYADLIAEAAALWESLSQNHPFLDGNKRTAFAAGTPYLAINGVRITAPPDALWGFFGHPLRLGHLKLRGSGRLAAQKHRRGGVVMSPARHSRSVDLATIFSNQHLRPIVRAQQQF